MPILAQQPINLMDSICLQAMSKLSDEYTSNRFYLPKVKKNIRQSDIQLQKQRYYEQQQSSYEHIKTNREDRFEKHQQTNNGNYKLEIQPMKMSDPLPLIMFKSISPIKQHTIPIRKRRINIQRDSINIKAKNSQSLIVLRNQQIEQMKKVQKLIIDVIQKQSEKLDHHFDHLQEELSQ